MSLFFELLEIKLFMGQNKGDKDGSFWSKQNLWICATGRQKEEDDKTFVWQMWQGYNLLILSQSWLNITVFWLFAKRFVHRKVKFGGIFFKQIKNRCHACHLRFAVSCLPPPSFCESSLLKLLYTCLPISTNHKLQSKGKQTITFCYAKGLTSRWFVKSLKKSFSVYYRETKHLSLHSLHRYWRMFNQQWWL